MVNIEENAQMLEKASGKNFYLFDKEYLIVFGPQISAFLLILIDQFFLRKSTAELTNDGFFFLKQSWIEDLTQLSEFKQTKIIKELVDLSILEVSRRDNPCRNYYYIHGNILNNYIKQEMKDFVYPWKSRSEKNKEPDPKKSRNRMHGNLGPINKLDHSKPDHSKPDIDLKNKDSLNQGKPLISVTYPNRRPLKRRTNDAFYGFTKNAISLFHFWCSLGKPLSKHKPGLKTFYKAMEALEHGLYDYDSRDIKEAMKTYKDLLMSNSSKVNVSIPGNLVGLDEFFGFSEHTKRRMEAQNINLGVYSWFRECVSPNDPKAKFAKFIEDRHPKITDRFKKLWIKTMLGGLVPKKFSEDDENSFRRASMKFTKFMWDNRKNILLLSHEQNRPDWMEASVHYVFDALKTNGARRPHPGYLASDMMYDGILPRYLVEQGAVIDGGMGIFASMGQN